MLLLIMLASMWICPNCESKISSHCSECWVCFNGRRDTPEAPPDVADTRFDDLPRDATAPSQLSKLCCVRCHSRMSYQGIMRFDRNAPIVGPGDYTLKELVLDSLDLFRLMCRVYYCNQCGHIEMMLANTNHTPEKKE